MFRCSSGLVLATIRRRWCSPTMQRVYHAGFINYTPLQHSRFSLHKSDENISMMETSKALRSFTSSSSSSSSPTLVDVNGNTLSHPPRFPLGATIKCHMGGGEWVVGKVIGHYYRELDWPEHQRAPYQVQITPKNDHDHDDEKRNIFVPLDHDDCVRTALRFPLDSVVECYLGDDHGWVLGRIAKHYHREPSWGAEQWAPYQIRIDDGKGGSTLIYAPTDDDACVRASWVNNL